MNNDIDRGYLGNVLIQRGFRDWFLYMFRVINGTKFIVSPLHERLFAGIQDIINGKESRININICPRSGKTTLATWLTVYALTVNPKSQIIYTSYSQSLLETVAKVVSSILSNPVYKSMYGDNTFRQEEEESNPVDAFWKDFLLKTSNKATYTTKKIITADGGVVLFSSIGGQITGFGAGVRGCKSFSGLLIIDDANKVSDGRSDLMLRKAQEYFVDTLLTRLNNSDTPIVNVQQRVHINDLSGFLDDRYNFSSFKFPLLDENGNCNLKNQYTQQRIDELKKDIYSFSAQYQQEPIINGGGVIKTEWFGYYPLQKYLYRRCVMCADTAMKVKEANDYSVFMIAGITDNKKMHIIDLVRGKWEAPELKRKAVEIWNKWNTAENPLAGLYIEDKASGTGLIQELKAQTGIPIIPMLPDKDKLTRLEGVLGHIEAGNVLLPENENYSFNPDLLSECAAFTRDDSHSHDDIVDTLTYAITQLLSRLNVSILDVLD